MPLRKIARELHVAYVSVCRWCADIELTDEQERFLWTGSGLPASRERLAPNVTYRTRRLKIDEIKLQRGCADCGYNQHPAALHFDHVDPTNKTFKISTSLTRRWDTVLAEIAKCVVRCANCHAVKTVERQRHVLQNGGRKSAW